MMKKLKLSVLILLSLGLFLTSCQEDTITTDEVINEIDVKSAENLTEIDMATEETSSIIEDVYYSQEFTSISKSNSSHRFVPDCVTITVVITQNLKTVTVDFGNGCELRNGNIVKGKIVMTYEKNKEAASKTITYVYEDFYFNDKSLVGGGSIVRVRSNENGNPQSTKTFDITITWPDNTSASKKGTKIREWIEGYGTQNWGDNVFLITGNWQHTKKNGVVLTAEIVDPLRRELACRFIVNGTVNLAKNENTAVLNYGDGACDNLATISINGGELKEIRLKKKR